MSEQINTLPNNIDAEQAFLGIIINDISVLSNLSTYPLPVDFYLDRNRVIAQTIYELSDAGKHVDIISVAEVLKANNQLEKIGNVAYLAEITDAGLSSYNLEYYANLIIEKSQRRLLIKNAQVLLAQAKDESVEINVLIEEGEKNILSISDREKSGNYAQAGDLLNNFINVVYSRMKNYKQGEFFGIKTNYPQLDNILTGFHKGELIILAARAGMGKTAFTLNLINNISIEDKIPTAFFSLEMSGMDIITRIVSMKTGILADKFRKNMLDTRDINNIMQTFGRKFQSPLFILDQPSMDIYDLRVQARRLVSKEKVEIVFVDYMGLIGYREGSGRSYMPRFEKVLEISKSLKSLARELQIPIVVLAQLNRDSEGKEPTLANIRDSGAIEQDADVVMMLHRKREEESIDKDTKLMVAKQRNGPVGVVSMSFIPSTMSFKEVANPRRDTSVSK